MTKNSYIYYVPTPRTYARITTHLSYPAYARNAITPIAESWKIEQETDSSIVVNWSKFLSEPIEGVDPFGGKTSPGRSLPQLNKILQVDVHEKNLEVSVQYGFEGTTQPSSLRYGNRCYYCQSNPCNHVYTMPG